MSSVALRRLLPISTRHSARRYLSSSPDPQLNGYPQLPWVSRQHLPAYGWQDPLMRRNFGDTVRHNPLLPSLYFY